MADIVNTDTNGENKMSSPFTNHPLPAVSAKQCRKMLELLASAPGAEFSRADLAQVSRSTAVPTRISDLRRLLDSDPKCSWTIAPSRVVKRKRGEDTLMLSYYRLVMKEGK